ncbi:protein FAM110C [Neovison vison]|uniref:protein FAM110C n=1 Tax=Neovison vison TaxID=452646 RepID=UPI001CEFD3EF|nr:protein FAM110C [Neogale vison]XP_044118073.1 protein FAM110C [Neogale vison]
MRALPALDAPQNERLLTRDPAALKVRDAAGPARRSAVERLAADRAKYVRGPPRAGAGPAAAGSNPGASEGTADDPRPPPRVAGAVARRAIARKPLRPDSLIIYRQKCDFVRGQGADSSRAGLVKKLFQGPGKDKTSLPPETPQVGEEIGARREEPAPSKPGSAAASSAPGVPAPPARPAPCGTPTPVPAAPRGPELRGSRRGGLQRSQSDLSSRYSASLAEWDTFFQFCGLEPEVVEALGRENFSAGSDRVTLKVRSVSVATSDSGFSRQSGSDAGLQEEGLAEQVPSTTSVVERNARIIKWLYTCRKAREKPGQARQGPA